METACLLPKVRHLTSGFRPTEIPGRACQQAVVLAEPSRTALAGLSALANIFRQIGNESIYAGSSLSSTDGQEWTRVDHGPGNIFEGIAYGNGRLSRLPSRGVHSLPMTV
jgi:hypothetical protein